MIGFVRVKRAFAPWAALQKTLPDWSSLSLRLASA